MNLVNRRNSDICHVTPLLSLCVCPLSKQTCSFPSSSPNETLFFIFHKCFFLSNMAKVLQLVISHFLLVWESRDVSCCFFTSHLLSFSPFIKLLINYPKFNCCVFPAGTLTDKHTIHKSFKFNSLIIHKDSSRNRHQKDKYTA